MSDGDPDRAFVASICGTVIAEVDAVVKRAIEAIRAELPEYSSLDPADQTQMVRGEFIGLLDGLAGHKFPGAAESAPITSGSVNYGTCCLSERGQKIPSGRGISLAW